MLDTLDGSVVQGDRYLQAFVLCANSSGNFTTPVTLCVNGMLVCGNVIGASTYLAKLTQTSPADSESAAQFENMFNSNAEEDLHIHLQEAYIVLANGERAPSVGNILWRGRLSEIDGFFFGMLSE